MSGPGDVQTANIIRSNYQNLLVFFFVSKGLSAGLIIQCSMNDLNIQLEGVDILFKNADDTNIVIPLWKDHGVDQSPEVMGIFFTLV